MVNLDVVLENLTTDECEICLTLPMSEQEIKSRLIPNCEYIVIEHDIAFSFRSDDVFVINEVISRINNENPLIDNTIIYNLLNTGCGFLDDKELLDKICDNDFMYEEIIVPHDTLLDCECYAAYKLFSDYGVPFTLDEDESDIARELGEMYPWTYAWSAYQFMGFTYEMGDCTDDFEEKIYIINMEDSEEIE